VAELSFQFIAYFLKPGKDFQLLAFFASMNPRGPPSEDPQAAVLGVGNGRKMVAPRLHWIRFKTLLNCMLFTNTIFTCNSSLTNLRFIGAAEVGRQMAIND
jgi:hypothetical protein